MTTHEVTNQPPALVDDDVAADPALLAGLHAFGAGWAEPELQLHEVGRRAGSAHLGELARVVNEHPPVLHTHDRFGNGIDEVEFHPYWHELMQLAIVRGRRAPVPEAEGGSAPEAEGGSVPEAEGGSVPEAEGGSVPEAEGGSAPEAKGHLRSEAIRPTRAHATG